jgi:LPS export ABC transporter protein LptC
MPFLENYNPKKLKLILLSVILIALGATIVVFVSHRRVLDKEENIVSSIQSKANISIGKAHQTATRNGIKEWSLDAASVNYIVKKNQAIFRDVSVIFYLKDKTEVYLTANKGILNTDSNNMELFGNVVVKNAKYRLKTENLHYKHNKRVISSKVPVIITGTAFDFAADSMSINLNTNNTMLEGKVEGTVVESIRL